ncbi:MAG TPA: ATP-grasp domain-containing protein, partial [Gemmatimonadaceae bacterium]|nr:ATP-grasp domain-containing protein [Gemmatimonadaceae bacterium]
MTVILPGSTIGILGGGQLGRMTGMAARSLGYDVHVLDPDPHCSARAIASHVITARFDDADAAAALARDCDVVTLEIEQIATSVLDAAREHAPTRPGSALIGMVQDRASQKDWLSRNGFPVGPWRAVRGPADVEGALREFGPSIVKTCRGGYDGRGQVRVAPGAAGGTAWAAVGERHSVAEKTLSLAAEISVMVARRPSGEIAIYPAALN